LLICAELLQHYQAGFEMSFGPSAAYQMMEHQMLHIHGESKEIASLESWKHVDKGGYQGHQEETSISNFKLV
jgi:hypothetical protein